MGDGDRTLDWAGLLCNPGTQRSPRGNLEYETRSELLPSDQDACHLKITHFPDRVCSPLPSQVTRSTLKAPHSKFTRKDTKSHSLTQLTRQNLLFSPFSRSTSAMFLMVPYIIPIYNFVGGEQGEPVNREFSSK